MLASTGDRHAAEELVAEAFARAWAAWGKVSRYQAPQAWVVRTALNAGVSSWRKRRREVPLESGQLPEPGAAENQADSEQVDTVMAVLARLPQRQREIVALRFFLDLDTATTAQVLGIAPGPSPRTWPGPWPPCATNSRSLSRGRPSHERRRRDQGSPGAVRTRPPRHRVETVMSRGRSLRRRGGSGSR